MRYFAAARDCGVFVTADRVTKLGQVFRTLQYLHIISTHYLQYLHTLSTQAVLEGLSARGHKLARQDSFSSVVVGVQRAEDGRIYANTDFRKAGAVDGF